MFGDKEYSKQPYKFPTPATLPEDTGCRTFAIPSDAAWFALFMGALYPLTLPESYEQFDGGISVETTAEVFADLIQETYDNAENGCVFCTQPGGEPIVRLNEDGEFEQLIDGDWLPPEGEYEIPPVEPRESGTDSEKRCLAAANATNVLKTLYETLADDYAASLTLAEAIAHFIAVVAALILLPGGLIAAAIALALVLFRIMFETAEFVTADYWTEPFDEKMQCALFNCASVDGSGVVTFDYDCFQNELSASINAAGDPLEVVLWGQIQAMLMFLGVDGLNLAGATTAIGSADCAGCANWCVDFDMTAENGNWLAFEPAPCTIINTATAWGSGTGWTGGNCQGTWGRYRHASIYNSFVTTQVITRVRVEYTMTAGATQSIPNLQIWDDLTGSIYTVQDWSNGTDKVLMWEGSAVFEDVGIRIICGYDSVNPITDPGGSAIITRVTIWGDDEPPPTWGTDYGVFCEPDP